MGPFESVPLPFIMDNLVFRDVGVCCHFIRFDNIFTIVIAWRQLNQPCTVVELSGLNSVPFDIELQWEIMRFYDHPVRNIKYIHSRFSAQNWTSKITRLANMTINISPWKEIEAYIIFEWYIRFCQAVSYSLRRVVHLIILISILKCVSVLLGNRYVHMYANGYRWSFYMQYSL